MSVIVTNTSAQPITVDGDAIFAGANGQHPVKGQLGPYETKIVNLPRGLVKKASAGAVSLTHNGGKGALLAMIHLQDSDRGYSESVNFTNPAGGKTTERHGAGLRLGRVNNDPLKPVIAVRNLGNSATTVTANVPYSKQNGDTGTIALPQISLAPGEIKLLNTSNPQLRRNDFATAGLEIKYTGAPGSVIASASSVSQSGNQVFSLPLKDPQGGLSSSGGYPWFIKESSSTVVFIKNVTDEQQEFMLSIIYPGGRWGSNVRTLAAGQTVALDVRKIRDSQEKGAEENVIPLDATSGHISWSLRGTKDKVLIGRAQTVDFSNGLSSTYECQCICGWSWGGGARFIPDSVTGFPGDVGIFQLQTRYVDCHGSDMGWYTLTSNYINNWVTHSSDNPSVATFTAPATGRAIAPGSTYLHAEWGESEFILDETLGCVAVAATALCAAFCDVQQPTVQISGPTTVPLDSSGQSGVTKSIQLTATVNPSGGTFSWSANSNKVSLSNTTSATVTVTSASASTARNDVTITVTYTVNNQNNNASRQITVVKPTSLTQTSNTINSTGHTCDSAATTNTCATSGFPGSGSYTSYLRTITYDVNDQFSPAQKITGANMFISESYANPTGPCSGPVSIGSGLGQSISDCFFFCAETCRTSGSCNVSATQTIKVNGFDVATKQVNWTCAGVTVQ